MSESAQQERAPRSLNELLKWSIKYHESEVDRTVNREELGEMDVERRKFLEKALKSLTVDEMEIMKNALVTLGNEEATVQEREVALDNINNLIDNLDSARDLQIIGGFQVVTQYLKSEHTSLKARAAEITGTVVQNDFNAQSYAIETGTLPLLFTAFEDPDPTVRKKVVAAVSSLIRNHPQGTTSFFELQGLDLIKKGIKDQAPEVQTKAVFFLYKLLSDHEDVKKAIVTMDLIPVLIQKLDSPDPLFREHVLSVLNLLSTVKEAVAVMKAPNHNLKTKLESLIGRFAGLTAQEKEAYREEMEGATSLLKICF